MNVKATELVLAAAEVVGRHPDARLVKNQVGNLTIEVDDRFIGHLDLNDMSVSWWSDESGATL